MALALPRLQEPRYEWSHVTQLPRIRYAAPLIPTYKRTTVFTAGFTANTGSTFPAPDTLGTPGLQLSFDALTSGSFAPNAGAGIHNVRIPFLEFSDSAILAGDPNTPEYQQTMSLQLPRDPYVYMVTVDSTQLTSAQNTLWIPVALTLPYLPTIGDVLTLTLVSTTARTTGGYQDSPKFAVTNWMKTDPNNPATYRVPDQNKP